MKSLKFSDLKYSSILPKSLLAALVLLGFWSCDHETDPPDGPNLIDRFGPFEVVDSLAANRTNVDFSAGETVVFSAQFNKNIDWVLTITGTESGAVKVVEGFDRFVSVTWNGGTTVLPFFKNEPCSVELTVPEEPDYVDSAEVEVIGTRVYPGTLFWDFEEDGGNDITIGNFEFELTPNTGRQSMDPTSAAEGEFFWLMEGTDDVVPNFFCGLIVMNATLNDVTYVELPSLVPEDVYFNCFIYNDGRPYGIAIVQFAFDSNDSGEFEDGVDQIFTIGDIPLDFEGWRQISHTMADMDMTSAQMEKIVALRVVLISDNNAQPTPPQEVQFGIDYMTFTQGAPLAL